MFWSRRRTGSNARRSTDRPRSRRAQWEIQERTSVLNRRLNSIRAEIDEIYRRRDENEKRVRRAKDEVKLLKGKRRPKRRDIEEVNETLRRRKRDLKEIKRVLKQTKREKKSLTKKRHRLSLRV
ncbi:unnamed protein product [Fusarium fujikuroi]|uniref:Uncharacterized protein n=1 Tax=Fusarium fujikuroi TaxID=5127 RepID=A0A2H3SJX6_FUSFU|nr:uncharacterized protein FFC1_10924 [Fusarium fujikuroi]SCO22155.1 uncharacterized protein FFE2_15179 [Fusarium fujikuroi]SCO53645.1 uncharacterized protein FFNC_15087 [Fusarium fujikuroi]SCV60665.1 uncharacterized protein FFFS_15234 [Fusarium fujikuroi]VTT64861.1 unnamed protein product [Fusarium fujikuroi]